MWLLAPCSEITGETTHGREGAALPGLRQTVVERVPGDPTVSPVQTGQDLCPGVNKEIISSLRLSHLEYFLNFIMQAVFTCTDQTVQTFSLLTLTQLMDFNGSRGEIVTLPARYKPVLFVSVCSSGWEWRQQTGVFVRACHSRQPPPGEPSTSCSLCQPAGPREGSSGGRGHEAGAVVHADGFSVSREGKCLLMQGVHLYVKMMKGFTAFIPNSFQFF